MLTTLERVARYRVVIVLTVAGVVDVMTGDPAAHGLALVAVAVALLAEEAGRRRAAPPPATPRPRRRFRASVPALVGGLAYAVAVGTFARFSWPLTIAVVVPGAVAIAFAWRATPVVAPVAARTEEGGALPWAAVFLALAAWEVQALLLQPSLTTSSWAHPTLSTLMDPILAAHAGRSVSLAAWLLIGAWLLGR